MVNLAKILLISTLLILTSGVVSAQRYFCMPLSVMKSLLKDKYKEIVNGRGMVGRSLGLLYVNRDTHTFSFVMFTPNNIGCMLVAGEDWEFIDSTESIDEESSEQTR